MCHTMRTRGIPQCPCVHSVWSEPVPPDAVVVLAVVIRQVQHGATVRVVDHVPPGLASLRPEGGVRAKGQP